MLAQMLRGENVDSPVDEVEVPNVEWAFNYIQVHKNSEHPLEIETTRELFDNDFNKLTEGTPDVVCHNEIFDLKWREICDYTPQMARYAQMLLGEGRGPVIKIHILFAEKKRAVVFDLDAEACARIIDPIIESTKLPNPRANDKCGWCANKLTCTEFTLPAQKVVEGRPEWGIKNFHSSEVSDPAQMGLMLTVARRLKVWCKAVEFYASEMATKNQRMPEGFELKEKAGKKFITDVPGCFSALGLPQEDFLKACDLRMNTSKKYPEKVGAVNLYAKHLDVKLATASREVKRKLEPFFNQGKPTQSLVATGATETEEEE